jgi:hypothetical protein
MVETKKIFYDGWGKARMKDTEKREYYDYALRHALSFFSNPSSD